MQLSITNITDVNLLIARRLSNN